MMEIIIPRAVYERWSKLLLWAVDVLLRVSLFNVPHRFTGFGHRPNVILNLGCRFTRFVSGSTTLVLERPSPAAGWFPAGFSFSGSTTLVLERPSPAVGWFFILVVQLCTGTAVSGGRLVFHSLVVQL